MKTLLPTSTAGSLPKPSWLAQPEKLWSPWKLQDEELIEGKRDALRLSLNDQQQAGIDIVSDGEQTRQHFVTTFIEHLSGVDFEKRETVRIRNRYDASVPTVVGAVSREKPVFVEDAKFLRQQTRQPIKWALPGPMTMIDTLYDSHYKSREKLAWEFAKILNQEARELEAAGVDIIQFDEPAFNVFFDEVNDWGVATLEKAIEGLKCETAVHICYGYGIKANTDWKKTLGSEWRQYEEASFGWYGSADFDLRSDVPVPLVLQPEPCNLRAMALRALESADIAWREVFVGTGATAVGAAVEAGIGVGLLAQSAAPASVRQVRSRSLPELPKLDVVMISTVTGDHANAVLRRITGAFRPS